MSKQPARTHTKRATYELRQRIVHGDLAGGARLYEVALAEEMNISRTPVREAMSRLAEEGLLQRAPGGGFLVRSFTYGDVVDAIELRGVLEGTAARLAAERGADSSKVSEINAVVDEIDSFVWTATDRAAFDRYSELNAVFHNLLAELCGSEIIATELERVKSLPFASPSAFVLGRADSATAHQAMIIGQAQHRALMEAIENREGARAEAIAREHARNARGNLEASRLTDESSDALPGLSLIVD